MGTFTAQILVGHAHPYHGGIQPTHQLFLSENDRPAWLLHRMGEGTNPSVSWIPTVEDMLEDGMLLLGAHVLKDARLLEALPRISEKLECYGIESGLRRSLHGLCRGADWGQWKVVVTVLNGSSIARQVSALGEYGAEMEVCACA